MGSTTSKAARVLPKTGNASAKTPPSLLEKLPPPRASEVKSNAIKEDALDPQFLAKLRKLGPVRVDHHMQSRQNLERTSQFFKMREISEEQSISTSPVANRVQAAVLPDLLDAYKGISNAQDLKNLAKRFNLELATLQRLTSVVNSPSILSNTLVSAIEEDGEEVVTVTAVWVTPKALLS